MNRSRELSALEAWWSRAPGASLAVVWGRRRVGKTALLQRFAEGRRAIFHTAAGRPTTDELRLLSAATASAVDVGIRDLNMRPFVDWDEALDVLAEVSAAEPLLLVLDEFPELVGVTPELPGVLRAFLDRVVSKTQLRLVLCGSAIRTMAAMQEERAPLYGRAELSLLVHAFEPHEAALMLSRLSPADRATVWGIVGGVPLYLTWWDPSRSIAANLRELVGTPGGRLLTESQLILATDLDAGELAGQVLRAIAVGRTKYNEIADAVRAEPARALDRLAELRLVERMVPVTEDPRRSRRRIYRITDNFLRFSLGVVDRYRAEIERGLGNTIMPALMAELDDHLGSSWEDAFRAHLRRLAADGRLAPDVVAVGRWWDAHDEIDAVVLAGRRREAVMIGETKWQRTVSASRILRVLADRARLLPRVRDPLTFAVGAREQVNDADQDVVAVTAKDIFGV